jgi:protein kinase/serine/threonine-protein kinase
MRERYRSPRGVAVAVGALALVALGVGLYYLLLAYGRAQTGSADASVVSARAASVPELLARAGSYLRQHQESDNEMAVGLYRRALQLEPENPQALAGLSLALAQRATKFNRGGERQQAMELAKKALALNPRLGLAHHALALALDSRGEVTPALTSYLRAAELEPNPIAALASAAYLLQIQGHLADALEANVRVARDVHDAGESPVYLEVQIGQTLALLGFDEAAAVWFERAAELRPDNVFAPGAYARMRLSQGRLREADEIAARAIQRGIHRSELPTIRGTVALMEGDEPRAKAFFTNAAEINPDDVRPRTRLLLLARRQPGSAAALEKRYRDEVLSIRQGRTAGDEWPDGAIDEMLLEAGFGHEDEALQALDTAISLGYRDDDWLLLDPMLAPLRSNPEFQLRLEKIRRLVNAERQRVVGAAWVPKEFLEGKS